MEQSTVLEDDLWSPSQQTRADYDKHSIEILARANTLGEIPMSDFHAAFALSKQQHEEMPLQDRVYRIQLTIGPPTLYKIQVVTPYSLIVQTVNNELITIQMSHVVHFREVTGEAGYLWRGDDKKFEAPERRNIFALPVIGAGAQPPLVLSTTNRVRVRGYVDTEKIPEPSITLGDK